MPVGHSNLITQYRYSYLLERAGELTNGVTEELTSYKLKCWLVEMWWDGWFLVRLERLDGE